MRIPHLLLIFLLGLAAFAARAASLPDPAQFTVTVERGDLERAREWLDAGLSPDFEGSMIGTGVMIGAWEGNVPMMELFHSRGADLNKPNALGEQALLHAAWKGHLAAVRWLLDHGAKVSREGKAWSALHYAVFAGHAEVVRELLARGADINGRSTNGSTPLMMAAREGREEIATRLLAAGARADLVNDAGEGAADWAMRHGHLRIAQAATTASEFSRLAARAATAAPSKPPPRSKPLPDRIDQLFAQARKLEAAGRRSEALTVYRSALAAMRGLPDERPLRLATGLTITAQRGEPAKQGMRVAYATPALREADVQTSGKAEEWLEKARALEALGQRAEALEAYRRAAAALRN